MTHSGHRSSGYTQWQEIDMINVWATPAVMVARDAILGVFHEKIARGLATS